MKPSHRYASDLARFAAEFRDESHLLQVLADLFTKARAEGVHITHGRTERGKDIVFHMSGGLSRDVLYACVVKNGRITGQAQSSSGAQTILNQCLLALNEPYTDTKTGREEQVHTVYVVSPYEPTPDAVESIKRQLQHQARQIEFLCGIDLLAFFHQHWPDFLRFESAVLTRYLVDLRNGLEVDRPLMAILARNDASLGLRPFESCYVVNGVELRIDRFIAGNTTFPARDLFSRRVTLTELDKSVENLACWRPAFEDLPFVTFDPSRLAVLRTFVDKFCREDKTYWEKDVHGRRYRDSPSRPEERLLRTQPGDKQKYRACLARINQVKESIDKVHQASLITNRLAKHKSNVRAILSNGHFVESSSGYAYVHALPGLVRREPGRVLSFDPKALFTDGQATLICGPPGSGKTSFCRWHTIKAIDEFAINREGPLPVYVPAHRLGTGSVTSFEDSILAITGSKKHDRDIPLRLFLDGLDEVPDGNQQAKIMATVRNGLQTYRRLAVVVTARPYVGGPWLDWLPRVHVAELTDAQQRELAVNWLVDKDAVDDLFHKLEAAPGLLKLMKTPLLATLILNLFRRTSILPDNKLSLYRTFVDLYCGEWDLAKGTPKRSRFRKEQKMRVLRALGYHMHNDHRTECSVSRFSWVFKGKPRRTRIGFK